MRNRSSDEKQERITRYLARDLDTVESAELLEDLDRDSDLAEQFAKSYDEQVEKEGLLAFLPPDPKLTECFSEETLEKYARGKLGDEERQVVMAHMKCPICGPQVEYLQSISVSPLTKFVKWIRGGVQSVTSTLVSWSSKSTPRWATATALTAAVATWAIVRIPPSPQLTHNIVATSPTRSSALVGDKVEIKGTAISKEFVELRIYREGDGIQLKCPPSPACVRTGDQLTLNYTLPEPGVYFIILVMDSKPIAKPNGDMMQDLSAMGEAETLMRRIVVR